jgi:hypothetical protein
LIWGNPGGSGNWNGEGRGRGRSVYEQHGARVDEDRITKEEGFQVSKRDLGEKGISKGSWQGKLAKGIDKRLRHNLIFLTCVYVL